MIFILEGKRRFQDFRIGKTKNSVFSQFLALVLFESSLRHAYGPFTCEMLMFEQFKLLMVEMLLLKLRKLKLAAFHGIFISCLPDKFLLHFLPEILLYEPNAGLFVSWAPFFFLKCSLFWFLNQSQKELSQCHCTSCRIFSWSLYILYIIL